MSTIFTVPRVREVTQIGIDEEEIGNVAYGVYTDSSGVEQTVGPIENAASIAKYGGIRRAFWIVEAADSPIRSAPDMTALLNAALADTSDPDALATFTTPPLVFAECAVDLYTFTANGRHFDVDQSLAPFSVTIESRAGVLASSQVQVRGKPSAGYRTWAARRSSTGGGTAAVVQAQYASDAVGSNASATFDPAVHSFARWSTDGGATWTDWFRIVGENGASAAGRYTDYIFKIAVTQPATPTGTAPAGWFDDPPVYDPSTGNKLWASAADRDGLDDSLLSTWSVPVQWSGPKGANGADGADGSPGLRSNLSNDSHTIPTLADGTGGNYVGADTTISVWLGGVDDSVNWSVTATKSGPEVTGALVGKKYTVTNLTTDAGWVDLTATRSGYPSLTSRFSLAKAKGGVDGVPGTPGDPGDDATVYKAETAAAAIKRSATGVYTPAALTVSGTKVVGNALPVAYAGRFIIATLLGTTWTTRYTSSGNESSKTYTPPAGIDAIRVRLYLAGGTSTQLDEEIVPIVTDGAQGPQGPPGTGGSASPTCYITQPYVADGEAVQDPAPVTYSGSLGAGGTGPLQWRIRYGSTWGAWVTTALPVSTTVPRHAVHERLLEMEVKDAAGIVGANSTMIAPKFAVMEADGTLPFSGVSDDPVYRKPRVAYISTNGEVTGIRDSTVGVDRSGEELNESYDRSIAGFDALGKVKQPVPRAHAAAELPDIDSSTGRVSTIAGTSVSVVRDQALSPSQNLMGRGTGEHVNVEATYPGFESGPYLTTMGLKAGDVISLSAEFSQNGISSTYQRVIVDWKYATGATISSSEVRVTGVTSGYQRAVQEAITIPAGAERLVVRDTISAAGSVKLIRNVRLNWGPRALPWEAPPFRSDREDIGDIRDNFLYRRTTLDEADGANRAAVTIPSAGELAPGVRVQQETQQALNVAQGVKYGEVYHDTDVVFVPPFEGSAAVIFGMGGLTYDSTLGAQQSPLVRALNLDANGFKVFARLLGPASTAPAQSGAFAGNGKASKDSAAEAYDDTYTFHVNVTLGKASVGSPSVPASADLYFYTNDGGGPTLRATRSFTNSNQVSGATYTDVQVPVTVDAMNAASDEFSVVAVLVGVGTSITRNPVTWAVGASPAGVTMTAANGAVRIPYMATGGV